MQDTLVNIKELGLFDDGWGDSPGICYYDGYIHTVGQARTAIYPSNIHYVFDLSGNIIHKITAPFDPRSEANISLLDGKITCIGGAGSTQDIWQFDPAIAGYAAGSWSLINADFTASIGSRYMAAGADYGGWFYIIGGWNSSSVYKTQDFVSWTFVADLTGTAIDKISACGCCVFNSLIWLIGGGTNMASGGSAEFYASECNGKVYTLNPTSGALTEILTDQLKFGQIWLDAVATTDYIYVNKGYIDPNTLATQYPPDTTAVSGNNRGLFRSSDGTTWESLGLTDGLATLFERHRMGVVNVGDVPYLLGGYNSNDMWKIV